MCYTIPMRYITNSELSKARRCLRAWYLSHYRRLYRRADSLNETNVVGDLVHEGLAQYYGSGQDPVATVIYMAEHMILDQENLLTTDIGEAARAQVEQNIETIKGAEELARIMVEGYLQWLAEEGEDAHLELLSVESERHVLLPVKNLPNVSLLGKLDNRFLDHRSNARVFMDHKTVQNFADRERWAHLDTQFRFYALIEYLLLLAEGMDSEEIQTQWTDGGIMNMLRRVKRTSSAKPPFYKRRQVRHSLVELRTYFIRISGEVTRIVGLEEMLDNGVDPNLICFPSPTRDCVWDCQFMTLCAFMDDGSDVEGYIHASYEVGDPLRRYSMNTEEA